MMNQKEFDSALKTLSNKIYYKEKENIPFRNILSFALSEIDPILLDTTKEIKQKSKMLLPIFEKIYYLSAEVTKSKFQEGIEKQKFENISSYTIFLKTSQLKYEELVKFKENKTKKNRNHFTKISKSLEEIKAYVGYITDFEKIFLKP